MKPNILVMIFILGSFSIAAAGSQTGSRLDRGYTIEGRDQVQFPRESITPVESLVETTWVSQLSGTTVPLRTVKAVSEHIGWAAGDDGVAIRTTDGGQTWLSAGTVGIDVYTITALDENIAMMGSWGDGFARIWMTTNGGSSWSTVDSVAGGFPNYVHLFTSEHAYWQGDPVGSPAMWTLRRTTDGGVTWVDAALLEANPGDEFGTNNSMFWLDSLNGWFGTSSFHVYRTTDGGATWSSASTTFDFGVGVWFNDMTTGLALTSFYTNRSTDGGVTWFEPFGSWGGTGAYGISGMTGTDEFWVLVYYSGGAFVVFSADAGETWSSSPPNGYSTTTSMWHINFVTDGNSVFGWAVGSAGAVVRFERITITDVPEEPVLPHVFILDQNYPNPFNPATTISFSLPTSGDVSLKILNMLGEEVTTLISGHRDMGTHAVEWDATGQPSGVYFYRLQARHTDGGQAGDFVATKRMMLIK